MTIDDLDAVTAAQAVTQAKDRVIGALRRTNGKLTAENEELHRLLGRFSTIKPEDVRVPAWLRPKKKTKAHRATPVLLLSDLHLDEVVDLLEMDGINEYDRAIAKARVERVINATVDVLRTYVSGVHYDGIVVAILGDILTGVIHDELERTNEAPPAASIVYWVPVLAAALWHFADEFGRVHVPCVDGNHDRFYKKTPKKQRAESSLAWIIYNWLADSLRDDDRITFGLSTSPEQLVDVYDTTLLLSHGDGFRSAGGVGGLYPSMMKWLLRRHQLYSSTKRDFDYACIGHWHSPLWGQDFVVNGCFPTGTRVITPAGPKTIETVEAGDLVLSRDGSAQKVNHRFTKTSEQGLVGLKVRGLPNVLWATPNHHIWAAKASSPLSAVPPSRRALMDREAAAPTWIAAEHLSPGDFIHIPVPHGNETPVDVETAWAYGLYIAEGHAILDGGARRNAHRIHLSMHLNERDICERWAAWFEKTYGKTPRIYARPEKTGTSLHVSAGREMSVWFRETFGHGSRFMHVPEGAMFWADHLKYALVEGWVEGDGCADEQDDCRPTVSATTISERLAWEMFSLAFATGAYPTLSKLSKGGRRKSDAYTIHYNVGQNAREWDGEVFYRVQERFQNDLIVPVFDLDVSGEHTYCVEGVGAHNSTKGYDEYAKDAGFTHSTPSQQLFVLTPERGMTNRLEVFAT